MDLEGYREGGVSEHEVLLHMLRMDRSWGVVGLSFVTVNMLGLNML